MGTLRSYHDHTGLTANAVGLTADDLVKEAQAWAVAMEVNDVNP